MSPILVRPVREQLEHDRVIRLLQAKYKRKFEVAINPGNERTAPVGPAPSPWYPDLVLQSPEKSRKLLGVVEVETTESVNNLEAMSEWVAFSRLKTLFYLYVPTATVDSARRMCTDLDVNVAELWAYQSVGDQIRFALIHRSPQAEARIHAEKVEKEAAVAKPNGKVSAAKPARPNGKIAPPAKPAVKSAAAKVKSAKPAPRAVRRPVAKTAVKPAAKSTRSAKPARGARPAAKPAARAIAGKATVKTARAQKRR